MCLETNNISCILKSMETLHKEFYSPLNTYYLDQSISTLSDKLKKIYSKKTIKNFLTQQRNYTLFKSNPNKKNSRNYYHLYFIDQLWEMDLVSLPQLAAHNFNIVNLLVVIDCFSRFAFVRPLQSKHPRQVVKALDDILKTSHRKPQNIQTDAGTEFTGKDFQHFLKKENISFRIPKTTLPAKCAFVESFNRTLKQYITRYLNWKHDTDQPHPKRYIDALPKIVDHYNRTKHSVTKHPPSEITKDNAVNVYHIVRNQHQKIPEKIAKLQVNDFVRVKKKRNIFAKGTTEPLWTEEVFRIKNVINRKPFPVYQLEDLKGRIIDGKLYENEIQKISLPKDTPLKIISHPNIFEKRKQYKFQTINESTRLIDEDRVKNDRKENNYFDIVKKLIR